MRKAAGILMIIVGMALVAVGVAFLSQFRFDITGLETFFALSIFYFIPGVLLVTGGGFCLRRRHWKLCFVSALLPVVVMFFFLCLSGFSPWLGAFWVLIPVGIPAIIFVWLRKREWSESQA